jgi:hypothetical protein
VILPVSGETRVMRTPVLFLLSSLALAGGVRADEAPPMSPQEERSLEGFAAAHPDCKEWNDGCATCQRDTAIHCSTPGIACQPHDVTCKAP